METMLQFNKKHLKGLNEVIDFLDRYIEWLDPVEFTDDGEESDFSALSKALSDLRAIAGSKPVKKTEAKPSPDTVTMTRRQLNDLIYTERKNAAESVNPNYRYAVVDFDVTECYLTDDIGVAMTKAANMSNSGKDYTVLRIFKARSGEYRTEIEGYCMDGHYEDCEKGRGDYLHFNFIASKCTVEKFNE